MILILEGADLVGKTTLAKELSQRLCIPQTGIWIDLDNPKPSIISVSKTLKLLVQNSKPDIIFDRFFISEWVYSKLNNREGDYLKDLIDEWAQVDDLFIFILFAKNDILINRYEIRGDERFSINEILNANELYQNLYYYINNQFKCFLIDISEMTTQQISEHIKNVLNNIGGFMS